MNEADKLMFRNWKEPIRRFKKREFAAEVKGSEGGEGWSSRAFCALGPIRQKIEECFELGLAVRRVRATRADLP